MLTVSDVEKIAKLANLKLQPEEIKKFQVQLSNILDYIALLDEIDTKGVDPTTHPINGLQNRFSETNLNEQQIQSDKALLNAKEKENGYFVTKAVL